MKIYIYGLICLTFIIFAKDGRPDESNSDVKAIIIRGEKLPFDESASTTRLYWYRVHEVGRGKCEQDKILVISNGDPSIVEPDSSDEILVLKPTAQAQVYSSSSWEWPQMTFPYSQEAWRDINSKSDEELLGPLPAEKQLSKDAAIQAAVNFIIANVNRGYNTNSIYISEPRRTEYYWLLEVFSLRDVGGKSIISRDIFKINDFGNVAEMTAWFSHESTLSTDAESINNIEEYLDNYSKARGKASPQKHILNAAPTVALP